MAPLLDSLTHSLPDTLLYVAGITGAFRLSYALLLLPPIAPLMDSKQHPCTNNNNLIVNTDQRCTAAIGIEGGIVGVVVTIAFVGDLVRLQMLWSRNVIFVDTLYVVVVESSIRIVRRVSNRRGKALK